MNRSFFNKFKYLVLGFLVLFILPEVSRSQECPSSLNKENFLKKIENYIQEKSQKLRCSENPLSLEKVKELKQMLRENIERRENEHFLRRFIRGNSTLTSSSLLMLWNDSNRSHVCEEMLPEIDKQLTELCQSPAQPQNDPCHRKETLERVKKQLLLSRSQSTECQKKSPTEDLERGLMPYLESATQIHAHLQEEDQRKNKPTEDKEDKTIDTLAARVLQDLDAIKFADFMYGVEDVKESTSLPSQRSAIQYRYSTPIACGYQIQRTYGTHPEEYSRYGKKAQERLEECNQRGFRAVRAAHTDGSMIYSIRGTVPTSFGTGASDLNLGLSHIRCADQLIEDVMTDLKSNKSVILSGHSLGGGLAEAVATIARARLLHEAKSDPEKSKTLEDQIFKKLRSVTINGFGGLVTAQRFIDESKIKSKEDPNGKIEEAFEQIKKWGRQPEISSDVNYSTQNDPITWITGDHHTGVVKKIQHEGSYAAISDVGEEKQAKGLFAGIKKIVNKLQHKGSYTVNSDAGAPDRKAAGVLHSHSSFNVLKSLRQQAFEDIAGEKEKPQAVHRESLQKWEAQRLLASSIPRPSRDTSDYDYQLSLGILKSVEDTSHHSRYSFGTVATKLLNPTWRSRFKAEVKDWFKSSKVAPLPDEAPLLSE